MKRPFFFNDQIVYSDDLNFLNSSKEDELKNRFNALLLPPGGIYGDVNYATSSSSRGGIIGDPDLYLSFTNLKVGTSLSNNQLFIYAGKALTEEGELIEVTTNLTLNLGSSNSTYSWLGSPNTLNYVKIKYLEVQGAIQSDDQGTPFYTRYNPSYFITVNNAAPTNNEILLATFISDASGRTIPAQGVVDRRLYTRLMVPASAVRLDPTTKPVMEWRSVEDHVNAKGSGTPSATNPHGLTPGDLGLENSVAQHRLEAHTSGIVAIDGKYDASVWNSFQPAAQDSGAEVVISFAIPAVNAAIVVGGNVYDSAIPTISLLNTSIFTAGNSFYYLYMDSNGDIKAQTTTTDLFIPSKFVLCSFTRGQGGSEISDFEDLRRFTELTTLLMRADLDEATNFAAINLTSTLEDNLKRIRHQVGRAITGVGAQWNTTPPLTLGPTSVADAYHQHTSIVNNSFTIGSASGAGDLNNLSLKFYRGVVHGFAALYWSATAGAIIGKFHLYTNDVTKNYAELYVAQLKVKENIIKFFKANIDETNYPSLGWNIVNNRFQFLEDTSTLNYASIAAKKVYFPTGTSNSYIEGVDSALDYLAIRTQGNSLGSLAIDRLDVRSIWLNDFEGDTASERILKSDVIKWNSLTANLFSGTPTTIYNSATIETSSIEVDYTNTSGKPSFLNAIVGRGDVRRGFVCYLRIFPSGNPASSVIVSQVNINAGMTYTGIFGVFPLSTIVGHGKTCRVTINYNTPVEDKGSLTIAVIPSI